MGQLVLNSYQLFQNYLNLHQRRFEDETGILLLLTL